MKPGLYKLAVYGYENLATPTHLLGRYNWQWRASLAAWWFEFNNKEAKAWVRYEEVIVGL